MQRTNDDKLYDFARLRTVIRERWWVIVLVCLVVGGLAYGASLVLAPRYSATAEVTYAPEQARLASQALSSAGASAGVHNLMSDALSISTLGFAQRVRDSLGVGTDPAVLLATVKITPKTDVDVISIKASGGDAAVAVRTANAFADQFVQERQDTATQALTEARKLVQARIDSLTPAEKDLAYGVALAQRRDDLEVLISMKIGDYAVLQPATTPPAPYFPRPVLSLEIALVVGLILGLALAVLLDYLDPRVKDQHTLERLLEMPVIGTIPAPTRRARRRSAGDPAIGFGEGHEPLLESMRMLRSNLGMLGLGDTKRTVLVTSPIAAEGKTTLAVNLALIMALSGHRVVLVDADLRNPAVHRRLGLPNARGLADALSQDGSWTADVQSVDLSRFVSRYMKLVREPARFLCITSGLLPSNASELLESEALPRMLREMEELSDYIVVDGPPLLAASDSLVLAQQVDAVVLSSKLGLVTDADVLQAKRLLGQAQVDVLGVVVSGAKIRMRPEYGPVRRTAPDGEIWAQAN